MSEIAIFRQLRPVAPLVPSAQTSAFGGEMKATEMFVVVALILLVFALVARFTSVSSLGVGITWGATLYSLPPSFICIVRRPCCAL